MEIKKLSPKNRDYPCSMCLVKNKNDYDLVKVENTIYVPLYQVIELIQKQEEIQRHESKRPISSNISVSRYTDR